MSYDTFTCDESVHTSKSLFIFLKPLAFGILCLLASAYLLWKVNFEVLIALIELFASVVVVVLIGFTAYYQWDIAWAKWKHPAFKAKYCLGEEKLEYHSGPITTSFFYSDIESVKEPSSGELFFVVVFKEGGEIILTTPENDSLFFQVLKTNIERYS